MRTFLTGLAVVPLLVLGACGGDSDDHNDADVAFAQGMTAHHEQAVEMVALVDGRAASPDVERIAAAIGDAQGAEIETMKGWLEEWDEEPAAGHGDRGGEHSHGSGMLDADQMAALEAAEGQAFDRLWLAGMITHHEGAIDMAETEIADGKAPEAVELAEKIRDVQQAEIDEMETLR
jgi:uncharacterized protein (DUF305 family)